MSLRHCVIEVFIVVPGRVPISHSQGGEAAGWATGHGEGLVGENHTNVCTGTVRSVAI